MIMELGDEVLFQNMSVIYITVIERSVNLTKY